jgi:hypothetical protein
LWENEYGQPFLVNGSRFLDDLTEKMASESSNSRRVRFSYLEKQLLMSRKPMARAKTPAQGAIKPQITGSSASNASMSSAGLKRPTYQSRPPSPNKRLRVNPATPAASSIAAPPTLGKHPLPPNWGDTSTLAPLPNIIKPGRKSYRPRPSSMALSVAPSSLFSGRTVSSQSSVWEEEGKA